MIRQFCSTKAEQALQLQREKQSLRLHLGFTVIEFVIVIGIIFFLAAALLPVLSRSRQVAKERNAREVIHQLEVAIRMYAEDCGQYPPDDEGNGCQKLIDYLENHGVDPPYCEWADDMKDDGSLKDPWGQKYNYRTSTVEGTGIQYNIWSIGPDGPSGTTDDDITNW